MEIGCKPNFGGCLGFFPLPALDMGKRSGGYCQFTDPLSVFVSGWKCLIQPTMSLISAEKNIQAWVTRGRWLSSPCSAISLLWDEETGTSPLWTLVSLIPWMSIVLLLHIPLRSNMLPSEDCPDHAAPVLPFQAHSSSMRSLTQCGVAASYTALVLPGSTHSSCNAFLPYSGLAFMLLDICAADGPFPH